MTVRYLEKDFNIERYPASGDHSLRGVSAADEYLLRYLEEDTSAKDSLLILHDRFGALAVPLSHHAPVVVIHMKSQKNSILKNCEANGIDPSGLRLTDPLQLPEGSQNMAVMRIPKSLDLFRFTVSELSRGLGPEGSVVAAFMTRHFSPQLLSIAEEYFEIVEQSRAWKKSRLLLMSGPKPATGEIKQISIPLEDGKIIRQYPGVFSSNHIDHATTFLLEYLKKNMPSLIKEQSGEGTRILDLGCGNGILSLALRTLAPRADIHLIDDSFLAIESAKLNMGTESLVFDWSGSLEHLDAASFDLVISNPPFHFEHEIDLSVPHRLFQESREVLAPGGHLVIVSNRHLNYATQLRRFYHSVETLAASGKFEILMAGVAN